MARAALRSPRDRWRLELATANTWQGAVSRRVLDLGAAVAVAAALVDAAVTYVVLEHTWHREANPIVAAVVRSIGLAPTLTLDAAIRFGIVMVLSFITTRAVRPAVRYAAAVTLISVAVWWTVVVFANAAVVARA
jgi:hypothetical protein